MLVKSSLILHSIQVQLDSLKAGYEKKIKSIEDEVIALRSTIDANDYSNITSSQSDEALEDGRGDTERDRNLDSESLRIRRLMMGTGSGNYGKSPPSNPLDQPLVIDTSGLTYDQLRMIPRGECEVSRETTYLLTINSPKFFSDINYILHYSGFRKYHHAYQQLGNPLESLQRFL